jgi:tetratricopeptide (TPR) repeat protein
MTRKSLLCVAAGIGAAAIVAAMVAQLACRKRDLRAEDIWARYQERAEYGGLTILYPLNGTLFPPEIVPPTFRWKDSRPNSNTWLVTLQFQDDQERMNWLADKPQWTPEASEWETIKKRSLEKDAQVIILGVNRFAPKKILSRGRVSIRTSKDEVGAPLFYREVNLPFEDAVKDPSRIRWRYGAISSPQQPPVVLEGLPVCGNCHSFSQDARILAMDVDYANSKGSYVITRVAEEMTLATSDIITWDDYRREDKEQTFGLLSQISPDGKVVASTVKDRSVFVARPGLAFSQLFFPIKGILAVYSRDTSTFQALPGADDRQFVQSNPSWSPDGKHIVFAKAIARKLENDRGTVLLSPEEVEEFLKKGKIFLFDLYRIPFNDGKGGKPEPLKGASNNGMSNFFARYSPDGKWIVFCKAKSYMLLQPDSELYIIPAEGGEARRLECNTSRMNSWHSWSPNSRWLVFSSKANSDYTQLFLAHIDEQGRSTPAVLLSHLTAPDRAANIPEFVNAKPSAIKRIKQQFLDDYSFLRAGNAFFRGDDADSAIPQYQKALEINPKNAEAHNNLGFLLCTAKKMYKEGLVHSWEAVRLDPGNPRTHFNLGVALVRQGEFDQAIVHLTEAARRMPQDLEMQYKLKFVHYNLGLAFYRQEKIQEAADHLSEAVRLDPNNADFRFAIAQALLHQHKANEAAVHLSEAVRLAPSNASFHFALAQVLIPQGKFKEAVDQVYEAARLDPDNAEYHYVLAQVLAGAGEIAETLAHYSKAVSLNPAIDKSPDLHDHLGMSYAEAGRFREAIRSAEKGLDLARAAGREDLAKEIAARIELYKQNKPYRRPESRP